MYGKWSLGREIDLQIRVTMPTRAFVAGMLSYQPGWMSLLYRVRWLFVRLLGMKQTGIPRPFRLTADDIPMRKDAAIGFFNVADAAADRYWFASASESHLTAKLGVVVEPLHDSLHDNVKRFHVITIVHYNSWAGPVYFNLIRPFHHVVVAQMMNASIRNQQSTSERR